MSNSFKLVDSLVFPVGMYSSEILTPLAMPKSSFSSRDALLKYWEDYKLELTHQRICRLVLSVQKKTSRLAVLGELGRYPVFLKSLQSSLMYEFNIRKHQTCTLLGLAVSEMEGGGQDCWLSRVRSMQSLVNIPVYPIHLTESFVSAKIKCQLQGIFDTYYLQEINKEKQDNNMVNRNKLRFYCTFKGSFKPEPYINQIDNRNQRKWISRMRTSAHRLEVETGRYNNIPYDQRQCEFCPPDQNNNIGTETHFLLDCTTFSDERRCLFSRMSLIMPNFQSMSKENKVSTLLCPATPRAAKLVNKYIGLLFKLRDQIVKEQAVPPPT